MKFIFLFSHTFKGGYVVKQLERQLQELQSELENLLWDQKELQGHLHIAVRERKERNMMEAVLAELEEEHDMAIAKIEQLEGKVKCVLFPT